MKLSNVLTPLLPTVAIALMVSCSNSSNKVDGSKAVMDNIMTRTSVRSYSDRAVGESQIETILKAGMAAPTAGNKQPWRFVVIRDKAILTAIPEKVIYAKPVATAPVAIVVCGDMDFTFEGEGITYWVQDASAATENILLTAHSLGLGAVWCGVYPINERVEYMKELLKLPENIVPLNVIAIGYPDKIIEPKDKWKPEYIHYNIW